MHRVVLNIPHAGQEIPAWARKDIVIPEEELSAALAFMTDRDVDGLWGFAPTENKQFTDISRLVVDMERYRDDAKEVMHPMGMGLYYTHLPDGRVFRLRTGESYARCLELYDAYHAGLTKRVSDCLAEHGNCILLDCHSFHDGMGYTGYDPAGFPDVCIGWNGTVTEEARVVVEAFSSAGYSVKGNEPFAGSLVPLLYAEDPRVRSVMIEFNRRIYEGALFDRVRDLCQEIFYTLCRKDFAKGA